jgi:hypothetical protein
MRAIAVDWSGATHTARSHIWLAEAIQPGQLLRLEAGRDRDELCAHLLSLPTDGLVIGLDFAFSFPAWFLEHLGITSAADLWSHVTCHGEAWLAGCEPPFWGRPGRRRPTLELPALRRTDRAVPSTSGIVPKSVFQVGGAGAVGTGSIRGMPLLRRLHAHGAAIWPFTTGGTPILVEIYPRLLTGPVHKSQRSARSDLLAARYPDLGSGHRELAVASEDAFDAAVSALVMIDYGADLTTLPTEANSILRMEGRIWHPRWREDRLYAR